MPRKYPKPTPAPLIVSRRDAAAMLGNVSVQTVIRLEAKGLLKPVRINPTKLSQKFYRYADLVALAQGGDDYAH
jgi:hypothetical protein